jgi:hypothetical protein
MFELCGEAVLKPDALPEGFGVGKGGSEVISQGYSVQQMAPHFEILGRRQKFFHLQPDEAHLSGCQ